MKACNLAPVDLVALQIVGAGLGQGIREFQFHAGRRWRFDLAYPASMVAFEVEGGVWTGGRHTRGAGYSADCEKYSVAAALGWRVIRATTKQIRSGEAAGWLAGALMIAAGGVLAIPAGFGELPARPARRRKSK
jgi:hypothetical protein